MECDLQPQSQNNILKKYADDTKILVSERPDCQLDEEFGHIENLSFKNKMIINKTKTIELISRMPHPINFDKADPLDGIAQTRVA